MSQFAVLDASGLLNPSDMGAMIRACRLQLQTHLAPSWNRALLPNVREVFKEKDILKEEIPVYLLGAPGDRLGEFGAHSEEAGKPVARVYVRPILTACPGSILWDPEGGPSVSSVLSHELLETEIDTNADKWVQTNDHDEIALEACDQVNGTTYPIFLQPGLAVGVSDFLLPRAFDVLAVGGKCDWLGLLTEPFGILSGGYAIRRFSDGSKQFVFGSRPPPAWQMGMKFTSGGRSIRRLSRGA